MCVNVCTFQVVSDRKRVLAPIVPSFRRRVREFIAATELLLSAESNAFIKALFPCENLYNLMELTMSIACKEGGLVNSFGANALSLAIHTVLVVISVFLFVLYASWYDRQCKSTGINALCVHSAVELCHSEGIKKVSSDI